MIYESKHPLVRHKLSLLRDIHTDTKQFRELVGEITMFLCYEACADLEMTPVPVTTPLTETTGEALTAKIGLVPILRAGIGMVEPIWLLIPNAQVWHIGMYRNEETLEPVYYYDKFSGEPTIDIALLLDPMLATGGSAIAGAARLKEWGVKTIKYVGLIAAPEGIAAFRAAHPDIPIHVAAIDSHLNEVGYIVPGLGDAGDRQFGT
jgi:uracil phosphoribosyltransferase